MANVKISELPSATTPLVGTEEAEIIQYGVNKRVAVSEIGGSQTLQQTMELGRIYVETVGDYEYTFKFEDGLMQLQAKNNVDDKVAIFELQADEGLGSVFTDITNNKSISDFKDFIDGYKISTLDNSTSEGFANEFKVPMKTAESGLSSFSIPNNLPSGDYVLLASDGNYLLLQANTNWKIGDYLNDQLAFIEGDASSETIYYRTNNNIFKGVILPYNDNNFDIGSDSYRFKDAYFSGDIKVNGNSVLTGESGTYSPTLNNESGACSDVTLDTAMYSRSGNIATVTITGTVTLDFSSGTSGAFEFSYPFAPTTNNSIGTASLTSSKEHNGYVRQNKITFLSESGSNIIGTNFYAIFQYIID